MGILFADINGFTRICEQVLERPERIGRFVDDWSEEAVRILHRHGGVFDKMVGDCVIGLFGPPFFKDDGTACAGAALKAAIEIQRFTREVMSTHPEISRLSEILQVPGLVVAIITLTGLITESAVGTDGAALLAIPFAGAGFVLGGPVVHWAHGNIGRGFGVLGLNIGAPAVTAGLGVGIACASGACSGSGDGAGIFLSLVLGGSAGLLAAMIVDVSVLSHGSNTPVAASALNKAPGWMILPDLHISREKTTFGVVGAF